MTAKRTDEITMLVEAAEGAVAVLEQLPEGEPFAGAADRAAETIAALEARARAAVFPDTLAPAEAGTIADLQSYLPTAARLDFPASMVALHGIAYPDLRQAIRGPRVTQALVTNARGTAAIRGMDETAAVEADRLAFEVGIATQLVANGELEPWAAILASTLPMLRARFTGAKGRHETAAAAAVERLRAEQAEEQRLLAQLQAEQEQQALAVQGDAEAAAKQAEVRARQLRAQGLAERLRRSRLETIRLAGGRRYEVADFVQLLDQNALSHGYMDAIEEALGHQGVLA